nr:MAG TPA: Bacterial DNA polymerase III alpha subunit [Caudoviricetes sp.]
MTSNLEGNEEKFRKKYAEIFKYVDLVDGVIVSMGNHPSACIVSPFPLDDEVGLVSTSTDEYRISQLNMKEIDSLNFVKLDVLR